jgi:DeoR family fructose operon transcriptional repressor
MLYEEERKVKIAQYVQEHSRASVPELSQYFEVSESTIRRDLKELEESKLLKRTHGGAVFMQEVNFEPTFIEKEDKFRKEKESIARKAAEFIKDGDTILLDSGTTIFHLAKEIKFFSNLTVVTNSLILAHELQGFKGIEVLVTGGVLRQQTLALVGPIAEQSLKMVCVDKAFIGTNGMDIRQGLTTPNLIEAASKRKMIEAAKEVILLSDHTKEGKVSFGKFADLEEIDKYIVSDGISEEYVKAVKRVGKEIYIVKS